MCKPLRFVLIGSNHPVIEDDSQVDYLKYKCQRPSVEDLPDAFVEQTIWPVRLESGSIQIPVTNFTSSSKIK